MSLAQLIGALVEEGVSPKAIALVATAFEARENQERDRRAANAERVRRSRAKRCNVTVTLPLRNSNAHPPEQKVSGPSQTQTPKENPPMGVKRKPFEDFWAVYPQKVGKRKAEAAFGRALQRGNSSEIMLGLNRAPTCRQWADGYVPYPATWLNEDRWLDEPSNIVPMTAGSISDDDRRRGYTPELKRLLGK